MNEAAEAAGKLAGQTDRALFLFVLVLFGAFGLAVVRYLVKRDERKSELVTGLFQEANGGRVEVAKALAANTEALGQTREQLKESTEILRKVFELRER